MRPSKNFTGSRELFREQDRNLRQQAQRAGLLLRKKRRHNFSWMLHRHEPNVEPQKQFVFLTSGGYEKLGFYLNGYIAAMDALQAKRNIK